MLVRDRDRIVGRERRDAGDHLVEHDAERVEIAAGVEREPLRLPGGTGHQEVSLGHGLGGGLRQAATGFSIGTKGYLGTGYGNDAIGFLEYNDFWEYTPESFTCSVPAELSAINVTSSSAKLTWGAVGSAEGYKIRYKVAGTDAWTFAASFTTSKKIKDLLTSTEYTWQVRAMCAPNVSSGWSEKQFFTTNALRLASDQENDFEVYPNPVASTATIQFNLNEASKVLIALFSVEGKKVLTIANENFSEGNQQLQWNAKDENGNAVSDGMYLLKISTANQNQTLRIVVMK
jgi:hypothetical protein